MSRKATAELGNWTPGFPQRTDRKRSRISDVEMVVVGQNGQSAESDYYDLEKPADLAEYLGDQFGEEDRQRLADASVEAALGEIGQAYTTPHVRYAAKLAAERALGIKPLPPEGQGE